MRIIQSDNPRPLNLLAVGPNGLVAAASDTFGVPSDVEVWEVASGRRRFHHPTPEHAAASAIAFTPDGRYLLSGEPGLELAVIDPTVPAVVMCLKTQYGRPDFALSADGTRMVVASSWNQCGAVECFAIDQGPKLRQLWIDGPPAELVWFGVVTITRDGRWVAFAESSPSGGTGGRPSLGVPVCDAETGKVRVAIPFDPASPVQQLAFTADGAKLVVQTDSNKVQLFDAATGAAAGELAHKGRPFVTAIGVHPRGPVACARTDGTVTFWDAETREQIRTLDWKAGRLVSVAFAPDGSLAAAGTDKGQVVVWDVDL